MVRELLRAPPLVRLRESAYDHIYLSPHLDDAVYSCAGRIALARAQGQRVLLVTLFGSGGQPHGRGTFDDYVQRTREERAAIETLDVDALFLDAPELTKRRSSARSIAAYALPFVRLPENALREELHQLLSVLAARLLAPEGELCAPLAIGCHPDHREAYELGRALHAELGGRVCFYEDLPYATLKPMRDERLAALGMDVQASTPLGEEARLVTKLLAAEQPPLARGVTYATVLAQRTGARALFAAMGSRDAIAPRLRLETHDIDAVVERKVSAMQAYATQTAYFFPGPHALPEALPREAGRYVERTWRLAPAHEGEHGADRSSPLRTAFAARLEALLAAH